MSKALLRLAQEMKKSVTEIDKILDNIIKNPTSRIPAAINRNNRFIEKKLYEIYNNAIEFNTIIADNNNLTFTERISPSGHIKIDITGDEIYIKMGRLSRKDQNPQMVIDDLKQTFYQLIKDGVNIPKLPQKVISVTHVYPGDSEAKTIRDNDNYNYKALINTLCYFTSGSDRGDNCWLKFRTKIAEDFTVGTEIRVSPIEKEETQMTDNMNVHK